MTFRRYRDGVIAGHWQVRRIHGMRSFLAVETK